MQPLADPDRALVAAAAAGAREAVDEIVRRYQVRIFNLARALTNRDDEAEDLAQEVFIRAWRAIGRFRGESSFRTWLYRVAINVIRSHLAWRSRRRLVWGWWQGETPVGLADQPGDRRSLDPEDDLVRRDVIDRALAALPADQRIAVTLRDVEGLEYREIAEALGVPIGTVMSRISRARARLRPLLAPLRTRGAAASSDHDRRSQE